MVFDTLQRFRRYIALFVLSVASAGCSDAWTLLDYEVVRVYPSLNFNLPVLMLQAPGSAAHWYVVEKAGRILRFPNHPSASSSSVVIDISAGVDATGEGGLLGMAFHPNFAGNGYVYVYYTAPSATAALQTRISRFTSGDGGATLDPASELTVLSLDQPYTNHNGGHIAFGPDGLLYIGLGDGGSTGDPLGHAQNVNTLLGAMLRIDVDSATPYAIPPGNPFFSGGGQGEIYAWGLRNPWRWSFDRAGGSLWLGDVGEGDYEEVNRIRSGRNYGWNIREGAHCYNSATCSTLGLTDPEAEYHHSVGCSVTGGYVYRGSAIPELDGVYVFGDYCSGRIWGFSSWGWGIIDQLEDTTLNIVSFAEDEDGELLIVNYGGGIYRFRER